MMRQKGFCWLWPVLLCLGLSSCSTGQHTAPVLNGWQLAAGKRSDYIVQKGDTVYSIAWAFDLDYRDLARVNRLSAPYTIHVGQKLQMDVHSRPQPVKLAKKPSKPRSSKTLSKKPSQPRKLARRRGQPKLKSVTTTKPVNQWLWPAKGKVVGRYSTKAGGNKGVNIDGRYGEQVVASAAGTVVYSGSGLPSYGKLVIIKHNAKYLSAYAFNKVLLVKENSRVKAGQKIAEMGRDNAGKVMLHFEIRRDGKPINPLRYLRRG